MNLTKLWGKASGVEYEGAIIELKPEEIAVENRSILEKFTEGVDHSTSIYREREAALESDIARLSEKLRQVKIVIVSLNAARGAIE